MTRTRRTVRAGVAAMGSAAIVAWALSACGSSSAGPASSPAGPAARDPGAALIEAMIARESIADRAAGWTVQDLFAKSGGVDSFRAEVVGVQAGKAFNDVLSDVDPHSEEVSFDDGSADWRTFHVRVRVLEVFGGDETPNSEVTLGLAFGGDLGIEIVSGGLSSMEGIVVFTHPESHVFSYDPTVQSVLNDGAFLSPVDGGTVPFPALTHSGGYSPKLIGAIDTLAELRAAGESRTSPADDDALIDERA
jgi:hypothetical protein